MTALRAVSPRDERVRSGRRSPPSLPSPTGCGRSPSACRSPRSISSVIPPRSSAPRKPSAMVNAATARISPVAVHGGAMLCAASDGKRIVTGGDDGKVVALDAKGEVTVLATDAKRRWIDNVALHPDGAVAWSAGKTAFVRSGKGDEKSLRCALDRRRARVRAEGPAAGGRPLQRRDAVVSQHGGRSRSVSNGPARISASPSAPTTSFWSPRMHEPALHGWRLADTKHMRMTGYPGRVRSMSWSVGGKGLATSGADTVIVWPFASKDGPMGKEPAMLAPLQARVSAVACHPKQDIMAAGYERRHHTDRAARGRRGNSGAPQRRRAGLGAGLERQGHAAGLRHRGWRRRNAGVLGGSGGLGPHGTLCLAGR